MQLVCVSTSEDVYSFWRMWDRYDHIPGNISAVLIDIKRLHNFSINDAGVIRTSIQSMMDALETAVTVSTDTPDVPPVQFGGTLSSETTGRPKIDIRPEHLAMLSTGRTTHQVIADLYQCSARTIRRRLLDYGLSAPGPPVYVNEVQDDGVILRVYSAGRSSDLSQMSDSELDAVMLTIYEQFPSFGRRMIDGYLMALGERVPRRRILDSYHRVIGPPVSTFGNRRIQCRVYSVSGPNSLWHHDGQHGKSHCTQFRV